MSEELTNLDWLSTIKTSSSLKNPTVNVDDSTKLCKGGRPKKLSHYQQQPTQTCISSSKDTITITGIKDAHHPLSVSEARRRANPSSSIERHSLYSRPPCSYSCLIAMALKASSTGYLPVHEIYRFVEREYPFFRTAPEGWKNSIRHNLSMNQNFMKLPRPDLFQLKKGFLWTFNPTRRHALELEIERALKRMGRHVIEISHPKEQSKKGSTISIQDLETESSSERMLTSSDHLLTDDPPPPPSSPAVPKTINDQTREGLEKLNFIAGVMTEMKLSFNRDSGHTDISSLIQNNCNHMYHNPMERFIPLNVFKGMSDKARQSLTSIPNYTIDQHGMTKKVLLEGNGRLIIDPISHYQSENSSSISDTSSAHSLEPYEWVESQCTVSDHHSFTEQYYDNSENLPSAKKQKTTQFVDSTTTFRTIENDDKVATTPDCRYTLYQGNYLSEKTTNDIHVDIDKEDSERRDMQSNGSIISPIYTVLSTNENSLEISQATVSPSVSSSSSYYSLSDCVHHSMSDDINEHELSSLSIPVNLCTSNSLPFSHWDTSLESLELRKLT